MPYLADQPSYPTSYLLDLGACSRKTFCPPRNCLIDVVPDPPSGVFYDPDGGGTRLESLGVHEHWNNAVDRQYSRNLGMDVGVELVVPQIRDLNDPVFVAPGE